MSSLTAVAVLVALVVLATALGLLLRTRSGRLRTGSGDTILPGHLGTEQALGARATLVQFSTPTCAQCPGTARLLRSIADEHDGVVHLEVDLTRHPEAADRFGVLQTPTTLLLDARHRVRGRIGGAPRRDALDRELLTLIGGDHVR